MTFCSFLKRVHEDEAHINKLRVRAQCAGSKTYHEKKYEPVGSRPVQRHTERSVSVVNLVPLTTIGLQPQYYPRLFM